MDTPNAVKVLKKAIKIARQRGGWRENYYREDFADSLEEAKARAPVCALGAINVALGETDPSDEELAERSSMQTWLNDRKLAVGYSIVELNDIQAPEDSNPAEWALMKYLPAREREFDVEGVDLEEDLQLVLAPDENDNEV